MNAFAQFVANTVAIAIVILLTVIVTIFVKDYNDSKEACGKELNKTCFITINP